MYIFSKYWLLVSLITNNRYVGHSQVLYTKLLRAGNVAASAKRSSTGQETDRSDFQTGFKQVFEISQIYVEEKLSIERFQNAITNEWVKCYKPYNNSTVWKKRSEVVTSWNYPPSSNNVVQKGNWVVYYCQGWQFDPHLILSTRRCCQGSFVFVLNVTVQRTQLHAEHTVCRRMHVRWNRGSRAEVQAG